MSALAHPGSIASPVALPVPRRRHLSLVPSSPVPVREPEHDADVIAFPAPADAPLRLTARGRRVLVALLLATCAAVGAVAGSVVSAATEPTGVEVVTVRAGDSLWSIAAEVATPGADIRDVMSQIAALNDLQGGVLAVGQELAVPSEG